MNKRIKKKKAKQAELKKQQEAEQFWQDPEKVHQALCLVGTTFSNVFRNLSVVFANAAKIWREWGEQFDKENSNQK